MLVLETNLHKLWIRKH